MYRIKRVESRSDWNDFIDLPWKIYRENSYWVPPLRLAVRDLLDIKKNPFFKHSSMYPILAYRGDECVGRTIGIVDDNHNRFHEEQTAFFGFFEAINDQSLTNVLMEEVARWAKFKGMNILRGPMNPSINHECGLLIDGFEDSPAVMMTYNPPYYSTLLEGWGLTKAKDLYAYYLNEKYPFADRLMAHADRIKKKGSIQFRTLKMANFNQEVDRILEIYNDAWEKNWGFVPMEPDEFRHLAKDLKAILDPNLCLIVQVRGKDVGFALTLPDVNQALKGIKNGRLIPAGIFKLLWNMKGPGRKKTINRCRIVTLGVRQQYRELGIGPLLYTEYVTRCKALGYYQGEASWILEDNKPMNKALQSMCGERTKVYRIYERTLSL